MGAQNIFILPLSCHILAQPPRFPFSDLERSDAEASEMGERAMEMMGFFSLEKHD